MRCWWSGRECEAVGSGRWGWMEEMSLGALDVDGEWWRQVVFGTKRYDRLSQRMMTNQRHYSEKKIEWNDPTNSGVVSRESWLWYQNAGDVTSLDCFCRKNFRRRLMQPMTESDESAMPPAVA